MSTSRGTAATASPAAGTVAAASAAAAAVSSRAGATSSTGTSAGLFLGSTSPLGSSSGAATSSSGSGSAAVFRRLLSGLLRGLPPLAPRRARPRAPRCRRPTRLPEPQRQPERRSRGVAWTPSSLSSDELRRLLGRSRDSSRPDRSNAHSGASG